MDLQTHFGVRVKGLGSILSISSLASVSEAIYPLRNWIASLTLASDGVRAKVSQ